MSKFKVSIKFEQIRVFYCDAENENEAINKTKAEINVRPLRNFLIESSSKGEIIKTENVS